MTMNPRSALTFDGTHIVNERGQRMAVMKGRPKQREQFANLLLGKSEPEPEKLSDSGAERQPYYGDTLQPWDLIVALGMGADFAAGNVIKYVGRYRRKNGLEDLKKAKWYLDRLIELKEQKTNDDSRRTEG